MRHGLESSGVDNLMKKMYNKISIQGGHVQLQKVCTGQYQ